MTGTPMNIPASAAVCLHDILRKVQARCRLAVEHPGTVWGSLKLNMRTGTLAGF